jgi:rhamnulokinase
VSAAAYLAVDLGAESGRAIVGRFDGERLQVEELHRFANVPVRLPDGLHWDAPALFRQACAGIVAAMRRGPLESVAIDGWAVDFGLLDREQSLLGAPFHYRDERTTGMVERAAGQVPRDVIYASTGIQLMRYNTLYQLMAMSGSAQLDAAERLLLIPDLIGFWATGEAATERTNASTTQLFDVTTGDWAWELINRLSVPGRLLGPTREPGTALGNLSPRLARELGLVATPRFVHAASHDTASAVAAVPAHGRNWAYISSGTWSLVGAELDEPELGELAREHNFTNELGFGGRVRFLKNVMGLWLLQESRRAWQRAGQDLGYDQLTAAAARCDTGALIDPDDERFSLPGDIPARIRTYCREHHLPGPAGIGETVRCIFHSLACKYRLVLERLEQITGERIERVHVVGGGASNPLLCQLTADVTGRLVLAGPDEATALGNVLVQVYAAGRVGSLDEMREVVRRSYQPTPYEPSERERVQWDERYSHFTALLDGVTVAAGYPGTIETQEQHT